MKKKKVSLGTIKRFIYGMGILIVGILIVGSIIPVSITISEDTINQEVSKKLPITKVKEIKIPFTDKQLVVEANIKENMVSFNNDNISTYTSGILKHKGKTVRFTAETKDANIIYDKDKYAFFYKPENINVVLNEEDLKPIFDDLEDKAREIVEPEKEKSLLSKFKDKFKKSEPTTIEVGKNIKVNIDNELFSNYKEKAKEKAREVLNNGLRGDLEVELKSFIETSVKNGLNNQPVYTLKDKGHDEKAKLFLNDVRIENGNLLLEFSLANILSMIVSFFITLLIVIGIIVVLTSGVGRSGGHLTIGVLEIMAGDL